MELTQAAAEEGTAYVENVGGIDEAEVTFSPGVTILVGRNATNRTSFLQGVMAALGSEKASVKSDAEEAIVELELGEETYTRRLIRRSGDIVADGDPFLEDATLADLFAFLLESNEARRAVVSGEDLRELIMRPVDTEEIQAEIGRHVEKRRGLEAELEEIDGLKGQLPGLEDERTKLERQIEEKKAELDTKGDELRAEDADLEESRKEKAELEETLDELRSMRAELDDVRYDLETEHETLEALGEERRELDDQADDLPEEPAGKIEEIEARVSQLRGRKQAVEAEVADLQSVIGFNEGMLEESGAGTFEDQTGDRDGEVTDELLERAEVTCWTCGSEVMAEQIEATLDGLRELSRTKVGTVNRLENEINELMTERRSLEQSRHERERVDRRLAEVEDEIDEAEETITTLQERRQELTDDIETIEAEVTEIEDGEYTAVLDLHREANQLEYELGILENELNRVQENLDTIEDRIDEQETIEAELEEVNSDIEELRMRIESIEAAAVEQFNEQMDAVLDMLDYANLDRIWLERVEREVRDGRRRVTKNAFELHVVRTAASGAAYEDSVDHLSESEREVTGLVFALAGYLAHEVYEELPFMLMDSLESIDAGRIATLVDHLAGFAGYLLVALLPEDANELPDTYERITGI